MVVVTALLFIFVVVHMVRMVQATFTPAIAVDVVRMGNMDMQQAFEGMIIRYERIYYADRAGRVEFAVNETERVRQGVRVASISDSEAIERITPYIEDAEDEIRRFHERRHFSEVYPTVQRINTNLHNAVVGSAHSFTDTRLSELNVLFDRLNQLTDNRNQLILSETRDAAGDAGRIHAQLTEQRDAHYSHIYASDSGIMFPIIDGFEYEFTPQNMRILNRDDLDVTIDASILMPTRDVEEGDPVFKLVGNTWYIAVNMPHEIADDLIIGADRTIFAQNAVTGVYTPILVRVMHKDQLQLDTLVIFRVSRNVMDFLHQRNINIRIAEDMASGLKIPTTAIETQTFIDIPRTHVHGGQGLYFVHHHSGEFGLRPVQLNVIEETETHVSIMEETFSLHIGDVLAPVSLYHDQFVITERAKRFVHGVYRADLGYAHFTVINLEGNISEIDGFTLVDPRRNPNLREFHHIVINASEVSHGDILD